MPTPEVVQRVARAIEQALDSSDPNALAKAALKAHEEWLAERIPVMAEAIRLALETGDNVPACLPDLCKYEPCACCEVAAKAAISAALAEE